MRRPPSRALLYPLPSSPSANCAVTPAKLARPPSQPPAQRALSQTVVHERPVARTIGAKLSERYIPQAPSFVS
jgi:hypothetical protein